VGKQKTIFVWQNCGYKAPKCLGRCPHCGAWNSLVEEFVAIATHARAKERHQSDKPQTIDTITLDKEARYKTGLSEFDRTLGGGPVPGSLVLIGGDPDTLTSMLVLLLQSGEQKGVFSNQLKASERGLFC